MKSKIFKMLCFVACLVLTGCNNNDANDGLLSNDNGIDNQVETFRIGHTLDDGRFISFSFDVPYMNGYLSNSLSNDEITIDGFINKLNFVSLINDGGSKLYKYNSSLGVFGDDDFYTLVCNSLDNVKDIFVAKEIESLNNKCLLKIDDLDGVEMIIKEGSLTNESATVIIRDVSSRDNIYGNEYRIDKFEDGTWKMMNVLIDNYAWDLIGYVVDEDNVLEFDIDWSKIYGKLNPGKYRIVKDTSYSGEGTVHYITAEFEI